MDRHDLLQMVAAAEMISAAAQQHEAALKALLERFTGSAEDARDTGFAFAPVSQALAHWRHRMSVIFPSPENDPAEMDKLANTLGAWRCAPSPRD